MNVQTFSEPTGNPLSMKMIVAIAIPVLLMLAMLLGMGGKGFLLVSMLLLVLGGWCLSGALDGGPRRRTIVWTSYVVLVEWVVFLFT